MPYGLGLQWQKQSEGENVRFGVTGSRTIVNTSSTMRQSGSQCRVLGVGFKTFLAAELRIGCVVVVQSLSHVQSFVTSWTSVYQAPLSFTISQIGYRQSLRH